QTVDGAWHLQGLLPPQDGVALSLALDSLSTKAGADDDRSPTQRRADALIELATLAMRAGQLPDTGGDQPRVTLLLQTQPNPFAYDNTDGDETDAVDTDDDDGNTDTDAVDHGNTDHDTCTDSGAGHAADLPDRVHDNVAGAGALIRPDTGFSP